MAFVPGQSGNPNGRPKMPEELREAFRANAPKALDTLIDVMENGDRNSDRVRAAEIILDRAYGKPLQSVDVDGGIVTTEVDTSKLPKEAQESLLTALVGIVGTSSENPVE